MLKMKLWNVYRKGENNQKRRYKSTIVVVDISLSVHNLHGEYSAGPFFKTRHVSHTNTGFSRSVQSSSSSGSWHILVALLNGGGANDCWGEVIGVVGGDKTTRMIENLYLSFFGVTCWWNPLSNTFPQLLMIPHNLILARRCKGRSGAYVGKSYNNGQNTCSTFVYSLLSIYNSYRIRKLLYRSRKVDRLATVANISLDIHEHTNSLV